MYRTDKTQLELFEELEPNTTEHEVATGHQTLTCANGAPWTSMGCGPCDGCVDEANRLDADFQTMLERGCIDGRGRRTAPP